MLILAERTAHTQQLKQFTQSAHSSQLTACMHADGRTEENRNRRGAGSEGTHLPVEERRGGGRAGLPCQHEARWHKHMRLTQHAPHLRTTSQGTRQSVRGLPSAVCYGKIHSPIHRFTGTGTHSSYTHAPPVSAPAVRGSHRCQLRCSTCTQGRGEREGEREGRAGQGASEGACLPHDAPRMLAAALHHVIRIRLLLHLLCLRACARATARVLRGAYADASHGAALHGGTG